MINPNYSHLNRPIRHAKLLREAGFELDPKWHNKNNQVPVGTKPNNSSNLIYWKRGKIRVTLFDHEKISLRNLITLILQNAEYQIKNSASVSFDSTIN